VARQRTDALQVCLDDIVRNKHGIHTGKIKTGDVRRDSRFRLALRGRRLWLLSTRLAIERECFPSKITIVSVDFAGTKVRPVEKNLQARSGFNIPFTWSFLSSGFLPCSRRKNAG